MTNTELKSQGDYFVHVGHNKVWTLVTGTYQCVLIKIN